MGLDLGGGWRAASVQLGSSPIMLVEFVHDSQSAEFARVDVDKGILVDHARVQLTREGQAHLIEMLRRLVLEQHLGRHGFGR